MMYLSKKVGLFLISVLLCACASTGDLSAQQILSLDEVITQAAKDIVTTRLSAGTKLVVLNFMSTAEAFSDYVIEELSGALVMNRHVTIIERRSLDLIRKEMNLQLSGDVSDDSAQAIGKQLGAQAIVTGSLTNLGDSYRFRVKVINVETARIEAQFSYNLSNNQQVAFLLSGNQTVPPVKPAEAAPVAPAATPPAPVTYKIGDTGPAGGIVFYDMGFYMDGWRYLEAAPQDFPVGVKWTSAGIGTFSTETGVGTGKSNTSYLVSFLKGKGESMRAAQVVSVPEYGGYGDWFLPSRDELDLMYKNLKKQRIGEFSNNAYWSSSGGLRTGLDWNLVAWQIDFSDGVQDRVPCSGDGLVRAVRRF